MQTVNFSGDFFEKLIFLTLTALVTGFGVPYVLKQIENRKLRAKEFEADLARQGKIIKAQSQLLDDLTRILWKWRYLAKKVTYYASESSKEQFEIARKEYDENVWELLNELRVQASKSRRLASEAAYKELLSFYNYVVHDIDRKISDLIKKGELDAATIEQSAALSQRFSNEVSESIDEIIDHLAHELHLKVLRNPNLSS